MSLSHFYKNWVVYFVFLCFIPLWGQARDHMQDDSLLIANVDPLIKILKSDTRFNSEVATIDVARGEFASAQFVIRSTSDIKRLQVTVSNIEYAGRKLKSDPVRFVDYIKISTLAKNPAIDRLQSKDGYYPDPLIDLSTLDVAANTSQAIWITVPIALQTQPGLYKGKVHFTGNSNNQSFSVFKEINIRVYNVQIKKTNLSVSLWPMDAFKLMNNGEPVPAYSEKHWGLTKKMAEMMSLYRQNVVLVYPLVTTKYTIVGNKYKFDFSNFDKLISIYKKAGVIGKIEGGFPGGRNGGGWDAEFEYFYYVLQDGKVVQKMGPLSDEKVTNFYRQFIPAFVSHLKENKLYTNYYQHIADEPTNINYSSYLAFYTFLKKLVPDIKIIEAVQTTKIVDKINIIVPQLDQLAANYKAYYPTGKNQELWFYTCWQPQGEYANRFIEQPLIKTRYLHWINYKYKIKGYLHWAYNHWNENPFNEGAKTLANKETLPGGDSWIVYPKDGGLYSSLRLEAMRDGVFDYELLKMLAVKKPALATLYSDKLIKGFAAYDTNVQTFREVRRTILQQLASN